MTLGLILGILVAIFGFVLILKADLVWRLIQKKKELTGPVAAFLRLLGVGALFLSVAIVQMVP